MSDRHSGSRPGGLLGICVAGLVVLAVLLGGCRSVNPLSGFGLGQSKEEEGRIRGLMKWHSGRVEVYRDFRTVFTARAIFISEELRLAVVDWEARSRLLSPAERDILERETNKGGDNTVRVLLGFYTPDGAFNDLDKEGTSWIPYIRNADGSVVRASCLGLGEEEGKIYMRFLQWDMSWSRLYMLCFSYGPDMRKPGEEWIDLVISSPWGSGEMRLKTASPRG
ncbi:MAG: hypothetical protein JSV00_07930 [bacterium]|nr:MAG: hypothetical protein JSV00_07930 [bacterium]